MFVKHNLIQQQKYQPFQNAPLVQYFTEELKKLELLHSITWISLIQTLSRDRFQFCIQSNWLLPILAKLLFQSATKTFPFIIMVALDIKTTIELKFCLF